MFRGLNLLNSNRILFIITLAFFFFPFISLTGGYPYPTFNPKYLPEHLSIKDISPWMETQVKNSLSYYVKNPTSLSKINAFYEKYAPYLHLVKFTIYNNKVYIEKKLPDNLRVDRYENALNLLCKTIGLPNVTFLFAMGDSLHADYDVPIFVMAKNKHLDSLILFPDFEAVGACYQVLNENDITKYEIQWERKIPQLIWRGGTVQGVETITPENFHLLSRVVLCELSQMYPHLIDAKFTLYGHGHLKNIPYLKRFEGSWPTYEEQLTYKYHIIVDGTTSAYTGSGWKLFSNSLVLRPDSDNIQWYFSEMKPYLHYIPVKANLEDLLEKLCWAVMHDSEAKKIAHSCRQFALDHITVKHNLLYLYCLIKEYSLLITE